MAEAVAEIELAVTFEIEAFLAEDGYDDADWDAVHALAVSRMLVGVACMF